LALVPTEKKVQALGKKKKTGDGETEAGFRKRLGEKIRGKCRGRKEAVFRSQ